MRPRSTVMLAAACTLVLLGIVLLMPYRATDGYSAPDSVAIVTSKDRQAPPRLHQQYPADTTSLASPAHARGVADAAEPLGYRVTMPSPEFVEDLVNLRQRPFCKAGSLR